MVNPKVRIYAVDRPVGEGHDRMLKARDWCDQNDFTYPPEVAAYFAKHAAEGQRFQLLSGISLKGLLPDGTVPVNYAHEHGEMWVDILVSDLPDGYQVIRVVFDLD